MVESATKIKDTFINFWDQLIISCTFGTFFYIGDIVIVSVHCNRGVVTSMIGRHKKPRHDLVVVNHT